MDPSIIQSIFKANSARLEPVPSRLEPRVESIPGIKAILFDVYGTLFVSGSGDIGVSKKQNKSEHLEAALRVCDVETNGVDCEQVLLDLGQAIEHSHAESKSIGIECPEVDIVKIWETVFQIHSLDVDISRFAVEFESRVNRVWPMPGLAATLQKLKGRFEMGIISNAQFFTPELFPAFLNQSRADLGFDERLEFYSYQSLNAKPGIMLFLQAVAQLRSRGIAPGETLYLGNDLLNDVFPAKKVGFKTALFAGDKRSLRLRENEPRVDGLEPELILTSLAQLPEVVIGS